MTSTVTPEVPVLGESLLRPVERLFRGVDVGSSRFLPKAVNPFLQAGAIANTCLFIAIITGGLLLFWYVPSVHQAYDSMVAIEARPWTAGLVRSLHRYSSDACMLFVLLHAAKVTAARRFTGPRWLAWTTGLFLLFVLWLVGYLGYWLVWDQPAQQIAVGTSRLLDVVPVFSDPMERSFLTDGTVNSLLFFIVFFLHMLLPLLMGIALWLHIARLNKATFLTNRPLTIWVTGSLVLMSLVLPAEVAEPASMAVRPQEFTQDYWYLFPVVLLDRLGTGTLWLLILLPGLVLYTVPWWMARGKVRPAFVEPSRCHSCTICSQDCPFNAISMVPRTDGRSYDFQAQVDPSRCVGCGICAGSCDTAGVGLHDWFPFAEQKELLNRWTDEDPHTPVVIACSHVAAKPGNGARVLEVPCAGWVHAGLVERVARKGTHVDVVSCSPGECRFRLGPELLAERLSGEREPFLRTKQIDTGLIQIKNRAKDSRVASRGVRLLAACAAATLLAGVVYVVSDLPYRLPPDSAPELVVTFKHPGAAKLGRPLTEVERARYPAYMNRTHVVERGRTPVRLRVLLDGVVVHDEAHRARGLWEDGNSIAVVRMPVTAGQHQVEVQIGDTVDQDEWTFSDAASLRFEPHRRNVVLFDRVSGFQWVEPGDAQETRSKHITPSSTGK